MYISTKKLILDTEKYYKTLKSINCPAIGQQVKFNRHGWNHLLYDGRDHRRSESQIRLRMFLFKFTSEILQNFKGYPLYESKKIKVGKAYIEVDYFELNHKIKSGKYIKIIIRKFSNGECHYYSIRRGKK